MPTHRRGTQRQHHKEARWRRAHSQVNAHVGEVPCGGAKIYSPAVTDDVGSPLCATLKIPSRVCVMERDREESRGASKDLGRTRHSRAVGRILSLAAGAGLGPRMLAQSFAS